MSLYRFPRHTPSLEMMLEDLGNPSREAVAKALGVSRATVCRWVRTGKAPRGAMLALFYVTRWGQSQVHCEAHNDAAFQAAMARSLKHEVKELQQKLDRLGRLGDFGAANDPLPDMRLRVPALPLIAVPGEQRPAPKVERKQTASQKRAARVEQRTAKRANGDPHPFDFLRKR